MAPQGNVSEHKIIWAAGSSFVKLAINRCHHPHLVHTRAHTHTHPRLYLSEPASLCCWGFSHYTHSTLRTSMSTELGLVRGILRLVVSALPVPIIPSVVLHQSVEHTWLSCHSHFSLVLFCRTTGIQLSKTEGQYWPVGGQEVMLYWLSILPYGVSESQVNHSMMFESCLT